MRKANMPNRDSRPDSSAESPWKLSANIDSLFLAGYDSFPYGVDYIGSPNLKKTAMYGVQPASITTVGAVLDLPKVDMVDKSRVRIGSSSIFISVFTGMTENGLRTTMDKVFGV
jgi:hypothetical protein